MELTEKVAQGTATEKRTPIPRCRNKNAVSNTKTVAATSFTINEIVSSYLKQNALVKMIQRSCKRRKGLYAILNSTDTKSLDAKLKEEYVDIPMMKEHAEHIGDNSGKIEHQREHFAMLSKDINDFVQTLELLLYQDYCQCMMKGKVATG
jgi:hypothetical protein